MSRDNFWFHTCGLLRAEDNNNPPTLALILINLQLFGLTPSGLLGSRMAHLAEEEFGLAVRHQGYPRCHCRYPHHG
jgi:hypothetical protein